MSNALPVEGAGGVESVGSGPDKGGRKPACLWCFALVLCRSESHNLKATARDSN
jgi:hypothetical protein